MLFVVNSRLALFDTIVRLPRCIPTALESFWDIKSRDMVIRFSHTVTHVLPFFGVAGLYPVSRVPPRHGGRVSGLQSWGPGFNSRWRTPETSFRLCVRLYRFSSALHILATSRHTFLSNLGPYIVYVMVPITVIFTWFSQHPRRCFTSKGF